MPTDLNRKNVTFYSRARRFPNSEKGIRTFADFSRDFIPQSFPSTALQANLVLVGLSRLKMQNCHMQARMAVMAWTGWSAAAASQYVRTAVLGDHGGGKV